MSTLDKFYDFTLNLSDAKLTSKAMSLCNIDRNVFNIYLTLQKGKNNPILNADLSNYTVTMIVVKPKTKEYVEKVGVIDGSNNRLLFELGETFNDQIGSYKGEIKVQNGDEVITSSSFAYTVTQSLISGLNAEIEANPDVEVLRQLINEVKAAVGMTPEDPDSLLTDYQKKTDETLTTDEKEIPKAINEINSQIKEIRQQKYDDITLTGNELSMKANGIIKKTVTLPNVGETVEGHTHTNKSTLDKITDEKIFGWDSKAEGSHNHDTIYAKKSEIPIVDVTKQYVDTELGKKSPIHEHPYLPNTTKVPTKTSELTNDSGFTTETYVKNEIAKAQISGGGVDLSGYATKEELNTKVDKAEGKGLSANDLTNTLKANYDNAYTHSQSSHAPANAQKNSDITKAEIEAKLTGQITSHTHVVKIPKDTLITTNIIGTTLTLTTDKYQTARMVSGTEIVLPTVTSFTEIHLFFSAATDMTVILPNCKWQSQPVINANKSYELIFTYTTEWLGGCVVYE